jgi:hypothetical protein
MYSAIIPTILLPYWYDPFFIAFSQHLDLFFAKITWLSLRFTTRLTHSGV